MIFRSVCLLLFLLPASADAFILRAIAEAEASACCRPDGSAHGGASFVFRVELADVEPEHFGRQLAFSQQANDSCSYTGLDFTPTATKRVVIESESGAVILTGVVSSALWCPFNAKARIVARFADTIRRDETACQKPCPDCVPWPPVPDAH